MTGPSSQSTEITPLQPIGRLSASNQVIQRRGDNMNRRLSALSKVETDLFAEQQRNLRVLRAAIEIARLDVQRCALRDRSCFSEADQHYLDLPQRLLHKPEHWRHIRFPQIDDAEIAAIEQFVFRLSLYVEKFEKLATLEAQLHIEEAK